MTNINCEAMGKLIEQLLKLKNMSVSDLAELIGVSKVSVGEWLKGKRPSIINICKIADIFNVTVDEIVSGKLVEEGTKDYLDRNFNLEIFDLDELIRLRDMDSLYEYFRRCLSIKSRYIYLLEKWSHGLLNGDEADEFKYESRYMSVDTSIFGDAYHFDLQAVYETKEDANLKKCVKEYFDSIANLKTIDNDNWTWEVEKLLKYGFEIREKEIVDIADEDVLVMVLYLINQQYKDELLEYNLSNMTKEDLSGNESFGALLTCGANYLYRQRSNKPYWDEEIFDLLEGNKIEDLERANAGLANHRMAYNFAGQAMLYETKDELKSMSYMDYKITINKKRTKYLDDLCNLKYSFPLKYYKNLIEGNYDDYF